FPQPVPASDETEAPAGAARLVPAVGRPNRRVTALAMDRDLETDLRPPRVDEQVFGNAGSGDFPPEDDRIVAHRSLADDLQNPVRGACHLSVMKSALPQGHELNPARGPALPAHEGAVRLRGQVRGRVAEPDAVGVKRAEVQLFVQVAD